MIESPKKLGDMTEAELGGLMTAVAKATEMAFAAVGVEKPHFVTVVFNDPKVAQYFSNCQRADMITAMRETADRLQSREDVTR